MMTQTEVASLVKLMGGYWPSADTALTARGRWLNDRGVEFSDAKAVLDDMAESYDRLPSVKDIATKLAQHGASTRAPIGVGDRIVIERMKATILEFAKPTADRQGLALKDRLRSEQLAAKDRYEEAIACDLGVESVDYWRDMVAAYVELLQKVGATA